MLHQNRAVLKCTSDRDGDSRHIESDNYCSLLFLPRLTRVQLVGGFFQTTPRRQQALQRVSVLCHCVSPMKNLDPFELEAARLPWYGGEDIMALSRISQVRPCLPSRFPMTTSMENNQEVTGLIHGE